MVSKKLPFNKQKMEEIIQTHPTPFHIYDEKAIRDNAEDMIRAFSNVKGFKEFFAVKALPNPYILKILAEYGFGADCSSLPELLMAEKAGITGENIMFSSNNTPPEEFKKAKEMGAIINLDDISHIACLEKVAGLPEILCFRYNPGPLKGGNALIGKPEEAKYGFTREQLFVGYEILKQKGVKRFGLHTMVASNELNVDYFIETARILFEVIVEISQKVGIDFEFVNLGGGIGIPYRPDQERIAFDDIANGVKDAYDSTIGKAGIAKPNVYFECGRVITGPYGYLVTEVRHMKHIYKDYVGTDACMANLMRPGIYGAYHHITVLGKENEPATEKYDVTGSLCENNDKFAIDRMFPKIERGDLLVIHDTGAHGFAMGFNYNGKLRSAELLLRPDGSVKEIRRAETIEDYFATLDFVGLKSFK
ncbi:MAG: diaminopimelate decarboxylase [Methanimicrococcus sp.]|nr:diaminopimelate decarboxylase [Methanimicrococcus sp.]